MKTILKNLKIFILCMGILFISKNGQAQCSGPKVTLGQSGDGPFLGDAVLVSSGGSFSSSFYRWSGSGGYRFIFNSSGTAYSYAGYQCVYIRDTNTGCADSTCITVTDTFTDSDCDTSWFFTGIVLNLPFNGNTNDLSGNANHATNYGATAVAGKKGVANTAYRFDSSNYMSVAHSASLNLRSFSITTILKPLKFNTSLCYGNCIVSKGANGASAPWQLIYAPADNGSTCYNRDTNRNNFCLFGNTSNPAWYIPDTPYMRYNKWYCVIATYDSLSRTAKMYVDGKLRHQWTTTWDLISAQNTMNLLIGKFEATGLPYFLNAVIDDIRIYNRVLAPTEVRGYCGCLNGLYSSAIVNQAQNIQIFPNPTSDYIKIVSPTMMREVNISIYDFFGRMVFQRNYRTMNEIQLSLIELPPAMYHLQIQTERSNIVVKLEKN